MHEIQARHAGSVERRVQLLHTIAELYETQLDDLPRAVQTYARALARGSRPARAPRRSSSAWRLLANDAGNLAEIYERQVRAPSPIRWWPRHCT